MPSNPCATSSRDFLFRIRLCNHGGIGILMAFLFVNIVAPFVTCESRQQRPGPRTWELSTNRFASVMDSNPVEKLNDDGIIVWEEEVIDFTEYGLGEIDDPSPFTELQHRQPHPQRRLLMWRKDTMPTLPVKSNHISSNREPNKQPHPLRTEIYQLDVRLRKTKWRTLFHTTFNSTTNVTLEFSSTGYVRRISSSSYDSNHAVRPEAMSTTNENDTVRIGEWEYASGTLCFRIPFLQRNDSHVSAWESNRSNLIFIADIHFNPFGPYPKLTKGAILLENRRRLFGVIPLRRILGTFVGRGTGYDTYDLSYRHRR